LHGQNIGKILSAMPLHKCLVVKRGQVLPSYV